MNHAPVPATATNITNQYDHDRLRPIDTNRTIDWDELLTELAGGGTFWLTTVDPAGRPHTRPVFAVRSHGTMFVASSRSAAKSAALHAGGPASLATSRPGVDIVWSGASRPVAEIDELAAVADAYRSTYGWDVNVDDAALTAPFGAPTAGPPPYDVFNISPHVVHAIGTGTPFTERSTRWDLANDATSARPGSIVVAGHLRVAADERNTYLDSCRSVVAAARNTDGCLAFAISADLVDPERINIYERWTDTDTLQRFRDHGPADDQTAAIIDARIDEFHTTS